MNKIAIVYWSGTGNTETMAKYIEEGIKSKGVEVDIFNTSDFNKDMIDNYDGFAFGCPSMGSEVLEECEFQPMWDNIKGSLNDKKVVLFGSYGWGDGEWMRNWEEEVTSLGTYICVDTPDNEAIESCKSLGILLCN